jgi:hypothetical protein
MHFYQSFTKNQGSLWRSSWAVPLAAAADVERRGKSAAQNLREVIFDETI